MWKHHMSCKSINMKVVVTSQSSGKTMQNQAGSITKVLETSCPKFLLSQCHGGPIGCNSLQNPQSQCRAHHRNIMHQLLTFQFSRCFFFRKQKSTWSPRPLAPCTPWAYSDLEGLNPTPGEAVGILQTSTSRWNDLQMFNPDVDVERGMRRNFSTSHFRFSACVPLLAQRASCVPKCPPQLIPEGQTTKPVPNDPLVCRNHHASWLDPLVSSKLSSCKILVGQTVEVPLELAQLHNTCWRGREETGGWSKHCKPGFYHVWPSPLVRKPWFQQRDSSFNFHLSWNRWYLARFSFANWPIILLFLERLGMICKLLGPRNICKNAMEFASPNYRPFRLLHDFIYSPIYSFIRFSIYIYIYM